MAKQSTLNFEAMKSKSSKPEIAALIAKTEPIYIKYHSLLGVWESSKSTKKSTALSFRNFLKITRDKLKVWDLFIQTKFREGSPGYVNLFANGKSFILDGTQEQIIMKFNGFKNNVENTPELVSIKEEVKDHALELAEQYGKKNEKFTNKNISTTELDKAYDEMGKILYYNMLMLGAIFIDDISQVEDYFDMTLLRSTAKEALAEETSLLLNIPASTSVDSGFMVSEAKKYLVISKSAHSLQFYGASSPAGLPITTPRELIPGEEIEVTGLELGAPANHNLIFINPNTTTTAQVEILEVD
jgi:hypothetical protein